MRKLVLLERIALVIACLLLQLAIIGLGWSAVRVLAETPTAPLHVGAFFQYSDRYGDNPILPGNVTVVTESNALGRVPMRQRIIASKGIAHLATPSRLAAIWVEGFTPQEVDASAGGGPSVVPLLGYVDSGAWTACPRNTAWVGVQAYRFVGETLTAFDARVRRLAAQCKDRKIALVVQTYDTNVALSRDVSEQFQYYYAWAKTIPNVVAVLAFSDGRALPDGSRGGLRVHANWQGQYAGLVSALLGSSAVLAPIAPSSPTGLRLCCR